MNKYCSNCGKELNDVQDVCLKCGVKVNKNFEAVTNKKEKNATVGFVLGLTSIVAWLIPLCGYPVTICGIVFSSKGLDSKSKGKAITGLVLSIVFLVLTLINSILGVILEFSSSYYY